MVLIKLVLHPILLLMMGLTAIRLGLPLDRFEADNGRIARIILLSTVLAFFTFSGAVALLV